VHAYKSAHTKTQLRKKKLYKLSACFVSVVIAFVIVLEVIPFIPELYFLGDIVLDFFILLAMIFWLLQWDESLHVYVYKRFDSLLLWLTGKVEQKRNTLITRI
jgi:hypothetical protein